MARGARAIAPAAPVVAVVDTASRFAAKPVQAVTGGQGGTVLLIAFTLFVGYLFLTRRLQRVLEVLADPAGGPSSSMTPGGPSVVVGPSARSSGGGARPVDPTRDAGYTVDPFSECVKYQMSVGRTRAQAEAKCASQRVKLGGRYVR